MCKFRFPAPHENERDQTKKNVILEIERQASEAWGAGRADAAYDFMRIEIPGGAWQREGVAKADRHALTARQTDKDRCGEAVETKKKRYRYDNSK